MKKSILIILCAICSYVVKAQDTTLHVTENGNTVTVEKNGNSYIAYITYLEGGNIKCTIPEVVAITVNQNKDIVDIEPLGEGNSCINKKAKECELSKACSVYCTISLPTCLAVWAAQCIFSEWF